MILYVIFILSLLIKREMKLFYIFEHNIETIFLVIIN